MEGRSTLRLSASPSSGGWRAGSGSESNSRRVGSSLGATAYGSGSGSGASSRFDTVDNSLLSNRSASTVGSSRFASDGTEGLLARQEWRVARTRKASRQLEKVIGWQPPPPERRKPPPKRPAPAEPLPSSLPLHVAPAGDAAEPPSSSVPAADARASTSLHNSDRGVAPGLARTSAPGAGATELGEQGTTRPPAARGAVQPALDDTLDLDSDGSLSIVGAALASGVDGLVSTMQDSSMEAEARAEEAESRLASTRRELEAALRRAEVAEAARDSMASEGRAASPEKGEPARGASSTAAAHQSTGGPDGPAPDDGEVSQGRATTTTVLKLEKARDGQDLEARAADVQRAIAQSLGCGQDEVQVTVDSTGTVTVEAPQQRDGEAAGEAAGEAGRSQAQLTDSVFESLIRVGLGSTKLKQTQFQDVSIALDSLPTDSDGEVSDATKRALLESIAEQSGVALADVQLLEAEGGRSDQADGHAAFTVRVLDASGGKRSSSAAVEAKTSAIEEAVADGTVAASMRRRGVEVEEFDASLEE